MSTKLSMVRGDSDDFTATVTASGAAVDVTGGKLFFTAKFAVLDDDPGVFQKSWIAGVDAGITVLTPSSGIATIVISPADTASLPYEGVSLLWSLKFIESNGKPHTLAFGTLEVTQEITRSV